MSKPLDHLHSYWRMEYIETPKEPSGRKVNPFAGIAKAKDDKVVHVIYRGKFFYIVLNRYPYNPGHLMVVANREVATLAELDIKEQSNLMKMVIKAQDILKKGLNPEGFNVGFNFGSAAGAGIPQHLHCHIVPRWHSDTNFMPVIAHTKILHQSLDSMWERLRQFV